MLFGIFKKLPKFFIVLILFITVFLLGFLLIGCMDSASTFSDAYLMKLQFNQSSDLFPNIEEAYEDLNKTAKLASMSITASYLAMCVSWEESTTCAASQNSSNFAQFTGISIIDTTESSTTTQIDLLQVARTFTSTCHPRILLAVVALTVVLFLVVVWASIPLLPGKPWAKRISCVLSALDVLIWGLGAMLQHEAVTSIKKIVGPASMYTLQASVGERAEALTWTAFAFLLLACVGNCAICVRDTIRAKNVPHSLNKI